MKANAVAALVVSTLLLASPAAADEVKILNPAGGVVKSGTFLQIRWDYTFMEHFPSTEGEKKMEIWLARPESSASWPSWIRQIKEVDVLAGKTTWPVDAQPGSYRLHFYKRTDPLRLSCAVSDIFTIEKGTGATMPGILKAPLHPEMLLQPIPISSPLEGQEYAIGTTMTIRWDKSTITDHPRVWLRVCWPNGMPAAEAFLEENTGSYSWTIKETEENWLKVSVYTQDNKHKGMSGKFHIIKPAPKIDRKMIRTLKQAP